MYLSVLLTKEQKQCRLHCASPVCCRQKIKLRCVAKTVYDAMYRIRASKNGDVCVT